MEGEGGRARGVGNDGVHGFGREGRGGRGVGVVRAVLVWDWSEGGRRLRGGVTGREGGAMAGGGDAGCEDGGAAVHTGEGGRCGDGHRW